jgi:hypothetical protein
MTHSKGKEGHVWTQKSTKIFILREETNSLTTIRNNETISLETALLIRIGIDRTGMVHVKKILLRLRQIYL